ncbi:MAG: hypothetical protein ACOVP4_06020 [Bacteriovoracaceae bacterium]
MQKIVFLFFLTSFSAYTQDVEKIINKLEQVNLNLNNLGQSNQSCNDPRKLLIEPQSKIASCAQEICGPPSQVPSSTLTDQNFKREILGSTEIDHNSELEQLKKDLREYLNNYEAAREELKKLYVNGKIQANTKNWADYRWAQAASQAYKKFITFVPQTDILGRKDINILYNIPKGSSPDFISGIKSWANDEKQKILSDPAEQLNIGLIDPSEAEEILASEFSKYRSPTENSSEDYRNEWTRLKSQLDSSSAQNKNQYYLLLGINSLARFSESGVPKKELKEYCRDQVCRKGVLSYINEIELNSLLSSIASGVHINEVDINAAAEKCYSNNLYKKYLNNRSKPMIDDFPRILDNFISTGLNGFSTSCREQFSKHAKENIKIHFDLSRETVRPLPELLKHISSTFNHEELVNYRDINILETFPGCGETLPGGNSYSNSSIALSPFTCKYLPYGEGVLSHELGHAFSDAIKKGILSKECIEPLKELRSCVKKQFITEGLKLESEYPKMFDDDEWKTEEDTADIFAFRATSNNVQFKCALLSQSEDRMSYVFSTSYNPSESHSPAMVRVVREALYRGKVISSDCREAMKEEYPNYKLDVCSNR